MGNRAFHAVVVLLWLSMMGWLFVAKVLPPHLVGEPPSYQATLSEAEEIICWQMHWNGEPMGWAASKTEPGVDGVKEVHSRVVLKNLPLEDLSPALIRAIVRPHVGTISVDAQTMLEIDPLGHLSSIRSTVHFGGTWRIAGRVENSVLKLRIDPGIAPVELTLPADSLLAHEFSPQAELRGLHQGQTWTMRMFSPFRSPEILEAKVEQELLLDWNGQSIPTWLVVYRDDAGAALGAASKPRGRMWVARDGKVLAQEVDVLDCRLRFERMATAEAAAYKEQLSDDWLAEPDD